MKRIDLKVYHDVTKEVFQDEILKNVSKSSLFLKIHCSFYLGCSSSDKRS